ncbi:MAG: hypothetical protein LBM41_01240 [Ruminococcus sp.]|jgi:hypothetical protein|nr:hypothetical protein [Ruminococcus sp.]
MKFLKILAIVVMIPVFIIGMIYAIDLSMRIISQQNHTKEYELMCKNIEENSEYYVNFSKKLISLYEEFGYDEFDFENGESELEYDIKSDLLGNKGFIRNELGITYVRLVYPDSIKGFWMINYNLTFRYYYDRYWIVYIPDEYMDEETIDMLSKEHFGSNLNNVKGNLFVSWIPENRH